MTKKEKNRAAPNSGVFQIVSDWKIKNYESDPLIEYWSKNIKEKTKNC